MGIPIEGFAYPYGDCDPAIQEIVSDAGYRWACSTRSDRVRSANVRPVRAAENASRRLERWAV